MVARCTRRLCQHRIVAHEDNDADTPGFEFRAEPPDPYGVLHISRHASWDDISAAYKRRVRWWHPDGLGNVDGAERDACEQRIQELNEAYQLLRVMRGR